MNMYLLLRNNKQSGPHSLEELKSMGLKAYDLVWSEGKSAAWRYPCELEELSAFAPAVEEQPFDRFYKKPSTATATTATAGNNVAAVSSRPAAETSVAVESAKLPGKRIIYVTMPAGKNPASVRETGPREVTIRVPAPDAHREPYGEAAVPPGRESYREAALAPAREPYREAAIPPAREAVIPYPRPGIEEYSSQPPASEPATRSAMPRRQPSLASPLPRLLTIFACILALLAAGIFIGLQLNKDNRGLQPKMEATVPAANTLQPIGHPTAQQLPAPAITTPVSTDQQKPAVLPASVLPDAAGSAVSRSSARKSGIRKSDDKAVKDKDKTVHRSAQAAVTPVIRDSAAASIPVQQREAIHQSDNAETRHDNTDYTDKEALRTVLSNQVSVGANGYSVGTFGGISDLKVTVTNRSAYPLDLVVVEVQYILANKKVYKTESLSFRGIGAGSVLMQEAPKSARGIKVQYKITTISSKELGLTGV